MFDTFYQRFILFYDSSMLVGFKIGEQDFDHPGVELVAEGGSPYAQSVLDEIHERRMDKRTRHDDKVGDQMCG